MQNDHPHRFFKPFNGIDAIGRWSVLAALCLAAVMFIMMATKSFLFRRIDLYKVLAWILISFGIMIYFACGLGLCLRIRIALRSFRILSHIFGVCLLMFLGINYGYRVDDFKVLFVVVMIAFVFWLLMFLIGFYLGHPSVTAEFDVSKQAISPSGLPNKYFGFGVIALGLLFLLFCCVAIDAEVYIRAIPGGSLLFWSGWPGMFQGLPAKLIRMYFMGGALLIASGVFLLARLKVSRLFALALSVIYTALPIVAALVIVLRLIMKQPFIAPWFLMLGFLLAYPAWSALRYLRSDGARRVYCE
ncbi:MAG: hypothetical protein ACYS8W_03770 [Planctomycetota bacterium]|jgi:hypothetical protein